MSRGTVVTFIPPNGLLRLLRFFASPPWWCGDGDGARWTVDDSTMREGRRFCRLAAEREGCHGIVLAIARASQKGHMDEDRRNIMSTASTIIHHIIPSPFPKSAEAIVR